MSSKTSPPQEVLVIYLTSHSRVLLHLHARQELGESDLSLNERAQDPHHLSFLTAGPQSL